MRVSDRVIEARAMFGLAPPRRRGRGGPACVREAARLERALKAGGLALVTGASGSGKSSLVRELARRARRRRERVVIADPVALARTRRAVIDLFEAGVPEALRALARAGLADATLVHLRARELSEGQRWRLALATAMHACGSGAPARRPRRSGAAPVDALLRGEDAASSGTQGSGIRRAARPVLLVADEFASTLDRGTALAVARSVRRWSWSRPDVRVVVATAHEDLMGALAPDVLVVQGLGARAEIHRGERAARGEAA